MVDSKGDCNKDQEHGHSDEALHPGLQVPQAWKEENEGRYRSLGCCGAASAEKKGALQGLQPVLEGISQLPGPEETFWVGGVGRRTHLTLRKEWRFGGKKIGVQRRNKELRREQVTCRAPQGVTGPQGPKGSPLDSQPRPCQPGVASLLPGSQHAGAAQG